MIMRLAQSLLVACAVFAAGVTAGLADSETPISNSNSSTAQSAAQPAADSTTSTAPMQNAQSPAAPAQSAPAAAAAQSAPVLLPPARRPVMKEAHSTPHRPVSTGNHSTRFAYGPVLPAYRTNVAFRAPQPEHVAVNTRGSCVSFLCPGYVLVGVGF